MNDGKIIIDKIIADAQAQADVILQEAKQEAERTLLIATEKAEKEKIALHKQAEEEKQKIRAKEISGAEMEGKKAILRTKQELLQEIVDTAHKRLCELPDAEYCQMIAGMLSKLDPADGTQLLVNAKDKARLAEVAAQKGFTILDRDCDISGGFIVKQGDIEYNYSFEAIISVEKEEMQQIAASILF